MIPSPWVGLILALAAYRLTRLLGWDDLPPIEAIRRRVVGAEIRRSSVVEVTQDGAPEKYWAFRRPLLQHFLHCPFCLGFWTSLVVYGFWLAWPSQTLYPAAVFALSGAVGLISKNLDP